MRRTFGDSYKTPSKTSHVNRFNIPGPSYGIREYRLKPAELVLGLNAPKGTNVERSSDHLLASAKRSYSTAKKAETAFGKKVITSNISRPKVTTGSSFNMPRIQPSFTAPRYFQIPSLAFFMPSKMDCIVPPTEGKGGIFLGNIEGAQDVKLLQRNGITSVLTVAANAEIRYAPHEIPMHKVVSADDFPSYPLIRHFEECIEFMDKALAVGNILVHCFAGMSRSSTIVIVYLMKRKGFRSLQPTLEFVKARRPIVQPNIGFMRQLKAFEEKLHH